MNSNQTKEQLVGCNQTLDTVRIWNMTRQAITLCLSNQSVQKDPPPIPVSFIQGATKGPIPTTHRATLCNGNPVTDRHTLPSPRWKPQGAHGYRTLDTQRVWLRNWSFQFYLTSINFNFTKPYWTVQLWRASLINCIRAALAPRWDLLEETIAWAFITCAQISNPLLRVRVPLRNGYDVKTVLILSLRWSINK